MADGSSWGHFPTHRTSPPSTQQFHSNPVHLDPTLDQAPQEWVVGYQDFMQSPSPMDYEQMVSIGNWRTDNSPGFPSREPAQQITHVSGTSPPTMWRYSSATSLSPMLLPEPMRQETKTKPIAVALTATKRKPIEGDCSICWDAFEASQNILYCRTTCGNNFHKACFVEWVTTAKHRETPSAVKCPMCRGSWDEEELRQLQVENGIRPCRGTKRPRGHRYHQHPRGIINRLDRIQRRRFGENGGSWSRESSSQAYPSHRNYAPPPPPPPAVFVPPRSLSSNIWRYPPVMAHAVTPASNGGPPPPQPMNEYDYGNSAPRWVPHCPSLDAQSANNPIHTPTTIPPMRSMTNDVAPVHGSSSPRWGHTHQSVPVHSAPRAALPSICPEPGRGMPLGEARAYSTTHQQTLASNAPQFQSGNNQALNLLALQSAQPFRQQQHPCPAMRNVVPPQNEPVAAVLFNGLEYSNAELAPFQPTAYECLQLHFSQTYTYHNFG